MLAGSFGGVRGFRLAGVCAGRPALVAWWSHLSLVLSVASVVAQAVTARR